MRDADAGGDAEHENPEAANLFAAWVKAHDDAHADEGFGSGREGAGRRAEWLAGAGRPKLTRRQTRRRAPASRRAPLRPARRVGSQRRRAKRCATSPSRAAADDPPGRPPPPPLQREAVAA